MTKAIAGKTPEYNGEPLSDIVEQAWGKLDESPEEAMDRILKAIDEASTLEDLLAGGALLSLEKNPDETLNRALVFEKFEAREGSFGTFAILHCIDRDTGERLQPIGTGSVLVLSQIAKAAKEKWFPFTGQFISRETSRGNTVYRIVAVPESLYEG